jgi:hypothetical protein
MVVLGDEAQVEARFDPFGDRAMQDRCTVCAKCTIGSESFWTPPIELLCDVGQLNLISFRLETVLDWCKVCSKCTIGSKIVLEVDKAQVEARFSLFGYSANLDAR